MTFVGKILVIVILAFALFFLALSTVVFTASTNWRTSYQGLEERNRDLQQQLASETSRAEVLDSNLEQVRQQREAEVAQLEAQRTELSNQIQALQNEATSLRTQVEQAQQNSQALAERAEARAAEAEQLREQFQAALKQANDYADRQSELNDEIFQLERQLEVVTRNNEDLRQDLADARTFLESRGLPTDPSELRLIAQGTVISPDIQGQVLRVDTRNELVEFSLGSDAGVAQGQEYHVFRTGDRPEYVGRIRVTLSEPDKSVGRVVDRVYGRKVREGDNVSAKIQPRS